MILPLLTWNRALRWLEFLGKLTFCIPHDKVTSKEQLFSATHDSKSWLRLAFHILICSFPFIFLVDIMLCNSLEVITGSRRFSEQIGLLSVYGATTAIDFIVKLCGLIFVEDLRFLLSVLKEEKCTMTGLQHGFVIASIAVASIVSVGYGVAMEMIHLNYEYSPEYQLALLPKSSRLYLVLHMVLTAWAVLSLMHSWAFIILVGMTLIGLLDDYSSSCRHIIITSCKMGQLEDLLGMELDLLKKLFESFGRIGGAYCLVLLGCNTLVLVRFLSGISAPGESKVAFQPGTQFYCYLVPVAIMIIAGLGSWLVWKVINCSAILIPRSE